MQHVCCELARVVHLTSVSLRSRRSGTSGVHGKERLTGAPAACGLEGANSQTGGFTCPQRGRARRVLLQEERSFAGSEPAWVLSPWAVWRRRRSAARTRRPARKCSAGCSRTCRRSLPADAGVPRRPARHGPPRRPHWTRKDDLAAGPVRADHRPGAERRTTRTTDTHTAGTTFFGQFLDHDMTFDSDLAAGRADARRSRSPQRAHAGASTSTRSTAAARRSPAPVRPGRPGQAAGRERRACSRTCPATRDGTAIIADPRNDENLIIAGLHAAFLLFHNRAVDLRAGQGAADQRRRRSPGRAQADHLALPVDRRARVPAAVRRPGAGRRHPAATAGAATGRRRAGVHAGRVPGRRLPVRPQHGPPVVPGQPGRRPGRHAPFFGVHLRPGRRGPGRPGRPARRRPGAAPLHRLADVLRLRRDQARVRPNKRIDTKLSTPLFDLPLQRHRQRRPAHVAAAAQPAAPPHLVAALRPGASPRPWASPVLAPPTSPSCPTTGSASSQHAAVLLRAEGGGAASRTACASGRSAAASWPRCSSACSRPIRARGWRRNPRSHRPCRRGTPAGRSRWSTS